MEPPVAVFFSNMSANPSASPTSQRVSSQFASGRSETSLGALLYGRDEGYYYRTTGLQLTNGLNRGGATSTRLFVERHADVANETRFNLSRPWPPVA